jgi:hypothetical protein
VLDQLARCLTFFVPDRACDFAAHGDERPQQRPLLDDLGVRARVGGARCIARQRAEIGKTAGVVELAQPLQVFGYRDRIAGLRFTGE